MRPNLTEAAWLSISIHLQIICLTIVSQTRLRHRPGTLHSFAQTASAWPSDIYRGRDLRVLRPTPHIAGRVEGPGASLSFQGTFLLGFMSSSIIGQKFMQLAA